MSISIAGTSRSLPGSGVVVSATSITSSLDVGAAAWPHGFSGAVPPKGSHLHASTPVVAQRPLVSDGGRSSQSDPLVVSLHQGSTVVVSGGQVDISSSTASSAPVSVVVYQLVPVGLEGPSTRPDGLGGLVRG